MFKKLFSLVIISSMFMSSAQLMSHMPETQNAPETEKCQEALARAEDAQYTAQTALYKANDTQWALSDAKAQAQRAIDAAKSEAQWAKADAQRAQQEAQAAKDRSANLGKAIVRCIASATGVGLSVLAATFAMKKGATFHEKIFQDFIPFLTIFSAGYGLSLYSVTAPYASTNWDESETEQLNLISKYIGAIGLMMTGGTTAKLA